MKNVFKKIQQEMHKAILRQRLANDPGIYPNLETEIYWKLVRLYPESEIEVKSLQFESGKLTIDQNKIRKIPRDIVENTTTWKNASSQTQSQSFSETITINESTSVNFSKNVVTTNSQVGTLQASVAIKGVTAGGSITTTDSISTTVTNSKSTKQFKQSSKTVSEAIEVKPNTILILRVRKTQYTGIYPFEGELVFSGNVKIRASYDGLAVGNQALEYVLRDISDRTFSVQGEIRTDLCSDVQVEYVETPIADVEEKDGSDTEQLEALVSLGLQLPTSTVNVQRLLLDGTSSRVSTPQILNFESIAVAETPNLRMENRNTAYQYSVTYQWPNAPLDIVSFPNPNPGCSEVVDAGYPIGRGRFCDYEVLGIGGVVIINYNRFEPIT